MLVSLMILWLIVTALCWLPTTTLTITKTPPAFPINEFTAKTIFYWLAVIASFAIGLMLGLIS